LKTKGNYNLLEYNSLFLYDVIVDSEFTRTEMAQMLVLIGGAPGAGKSTLAKKMLTDGDVNCMFEADMFFTITASPTGYKFNAQLLPMAHKWCQNEARGALEAGKTVAVSNTFTKRWERTEYYKMAAEFGVDVILIHCTGEFENVHGVPDEKVQQMRDRWED